MNITSVNREDALDLLKRYNSDPFHMVHALTVEGVMAHLAYELGYEEEVPFWAMVGLLHDVDYGTCPDEHLDHAPRLLKEIGGEEALIHAVLSHGYGICSQIKPEHEMEKVLYATDELTGLIWAGVLVRPSKSVQDMEVKSIKKKFKDKHFAAGCNRDIIKNGAEMLDWELSDLFTRTLSAMKAKEPFVLSEIKRLGIDYSVEGHHNG